MSSDRGQGAAALTLRGRSAVGPEWLIGVVVSVQGGRARRSSSDRHGVVMVVVAAVNAIVVGG